MKNYGLKFDAPAKDWLSAMPLGNGHIGVMMHGCTDKETLCLNDDTLWSGYKRDYTKTDFRENLDKVRRLMLDGEKLEAQEIIESKMLDRFTQAYLPLGNIVIDFEEGVVGDYKRNLNFDSGTANVSYIKNGYQYNITCFCSYPKDVMVYKISCDAEFSFSVNMNSQLRYVTDAHDNTICINGIAPSDIVIRDVYNFLGEGNTISYEESDKSIKFKGELRVVTDGDINTKDSLCIDRCTQAIIYYTSATSFAKKNEAVYCNNILENAISMGYNRLLEEHIKDYSELYARVGIDLGNDKMTTDEIYHQAKLGKVNGYAIATLFQYGRYLLISSSREGTQPANLQGIWNKDLIPPWWCNYTLNINLQMNYWHAQRTNLSECVEPLFDYIYRLCERGKETAYKNYRMKGFVVHHQSDIWAHTTPVGFENKREKDSGSWAMWNMSGAWLCLHIYKHYAFNGDVEFLSKYAYPIFKECAVFLFDWMIQMEDTYATLPSTSPENLYYGETGERISVCSTSAMDIGILSEFFKALIDVCKIVHDKDLYNRAQNVLDNLPIYKVENERLLEWDKDYTPIDPGHRHFSMLLGLYPYDHLLKGHKNFAENSLNQRLNSGGGSTGWSTAWAIALYARLKDYEKSYQYVLSLFQNHLHKNLLGAHPPDYFQIDANFGLTAAVSEMIVQDCDGIIRPLPAIPKELNTGKIKGFKLEGGHVISIKWKDGKLVEIRLEAGFEKTIKIALNDVKVYCDGEYIAVESIESGIVINLVQGEEYRISGELICHTLI